MGNTCKAAPVERETQLPSGAPAGGGEELAEMLQAKENQWRELERGYKQQMRQLEEQNRGFQDDIHNLQTLTEELLASKEGGGPDGEHGEFRGGPHDEGALAETMEEVERLRDLVAEFERGSAEVVGFREKVEALESRNAELEERASSQQKAAPSSRELVALQAERRALVEEKVGLESTLEETRMQLTKAEEELSKQSPDDHAQAELSDLRAENMGLAQRCKALTELAEQACARAEDVAQKFEQAAALHGNGGNSDDGHPSAEDVLSKTNLVVPAYLRVEGRPVTPAPLGGSYTAAAPAAVGTFGLSVSVGGLSTTSTSGFVSDAPQRVSWIGRFDAAGAVLFCSGSPGADLCGNLSWRWAPRHLPGGDCGSTCLAGIHVTINAACSTTSTWHRVGPLIIERRVVFVPLSCEQWGSDQIASA